MKIDFFQKNISFWHISLNDKLLFVSQLSVMLKSGLSITEALAVLEDETNGRLRKVLKYILNSVSAGSTLSASLSSFGDIFSNFLINIVRAGEASGSLEEKLVSAAKQIKRKKELKDEIRSAMVYPLVVLGMSFILGVIIFTVVLPKITPIFKSLKVELPASTRALIKISTLIQNHGGQLLFLGVLAVLFLIWASKKDPVKRITHYLILHLPLIKNISRSNNLAVFSQTLASLLHSGISIDESLEIARDTVDNFYYKKAISKVVLGIKSGNKLSVELGKHKEYFPQMMLSLVRVGEKSGRLEESLFDLAEYYENKIKDYLKILSSSLEPILLIVVGLIVAWLAMAIITPIYEVTSIVYR